MKRITQRVLATFSSAALAVLVFAHVSGQEGQSFCANNEKAQFNNELPLSHPQNICAQSQFESVSWSSWFSGKSSGFQFHYLDLLELLSRSTDKHEHRPHGPR